MHDLRIIITNEWKKFLTNCTRHKICQSAIYNACILFCDCLKITKQITQNTQIQVQALYNDRYHKTVSYLNEKKQINMIPGWQLHFVSVNVQKYYNIFMLYVFLVFNTLQQKTRSTYLLKVILLTIFSDKGVFAEPLSQCLLSDIRSCTT